MKELEYIINQYKILHEKEKYGISSICLLGAISTLVKELNPKYVIDFGCGQSTLVDALAGEFEDTLFIRYDPAIERYSIKPKMKFGLVICTDVLEHIPEECLDYVITEIKELSDNVIFNISTQLAFWNLPDGTNCHKTIQNDEWWKKKLSAYFSTVETFLSPFAGLGVKTWSKK